MNTVAERDKNIDIGIDVGSTTVKVVACLANGDDTLFRRYVRHKGRQADVLLSCLKELHDTVRFPAENARAFITGSGGAALAPLIGARFVQEVTAVSMAVERLYPSVSSVIELGGQDSKIIVFQETDRPGQKKKLATMNDRCAGGTGAIIDKIAAKLHLEPAQLTQQRYDGVALHPVAGKCGVFAETDITGLQKQGVPAGELIASLFDAIVLQNLTVLTRGHELRPRVLLLGGPNLFLLGLQQAWKHHLPRLWRERRIPLPEEVDSECLVTVPADAQFFGAIGAIEYGRSETVSSGTYFGFHSLQQARCEESADGAGGGLSGSPDELHSFLAQYGRARQARPQLTPGELPVFLGIDGGSTSTKAAVLSTEGELLASAYRLSQADPIADAVAVLEELHEYFRERQVQLKVLGAATTGYSKDILQKVLGADVALVETVAHANSALKIHPDVDAIIDVGGQDIKIVLLQDGAVKDFRLNTQCSAGNGFFLQSTAEALGVPIEKFAETAFRATRMPVFSYGCAVFLQADIVNFQRQGWQPDELIAGLAAVLPKNVFLYVADVANVAKLGKRFLLQGGTQRNLAVVKAEVDFIRSRYFAEGVPEIHVHPHCGEAGSIGAALEALRRYSPERTSRFIALDRLQTLQYTVTRDESTRCKFCANRCSRTFVDFTCAATDGAPADSTNRVIIASCERGEALNVEGAREVHHAWTALREAAPCIPSIAATEAFRIRELPSLRAARRGANRAQLPLRIGIPRVLNLFANAPFLTAYLESVGIRKEQIVFSPPTKPQLIKEAVGLAAIDPCFPSKVCVAHVLHLLRQSTGGDKLDCIFFPMVDTIATGLDNCVSCNACPAGSATPEAVKAAFTASRDWLAEAGVAYLNPVLNFSDHSLLRLQMFECWRDLLKLSWEENSRAIEQALRAQEHFDEEMRQLSRSVLDKLEREGGIGLVLLGRPYHHDPGINQGILEAFQKLGYPVLSQSYLPRDEETVAELFGAEVEAGLIGSHFDISDVWKNSSSANTNLKVWAAKFTARHPNLIPVELSNFKCGHDAFVANVLEQISACAGKPHFRFRDLDENKPQASLRLRIETMDFFLKNSERFSHSRRPDSARELPIENRFLDSAESAEA
jgi:predicted CoA-substrate-specific enzyme activase